MKNIFGVDSVTPANQKLKNGYTMYEWVMRQKGFPAFWGRPISGDHALTEEERQFFKEKGCKLCLLFDELTEKDISGTNGDADALRAAAAAQALGVPRNKGIVIYVNVPSNGSINHNWMLSFANTLAADGYVPGFIGNTDSSLNFNFDRQSSHYMQAIGGKKSLPTSFGATEPKCDHSPTTWEPYCPSAMQQEDIDLWRCGEVTFDLLSANTVYARDDEAMNGFWDMTEKEEN